MRVAAGALALALLAGGSAWALGYATGRYAGKTAQRKSISFTAGRSAVHQLRFRERGSCSNGLTSSGAQGPISAAIARGRFSHDGVSPTGATRLHVQGRLAGHSASGTFSVRARFSASGRPDPQGPIVCRTGTVRWSATHP